MLSQEEEGVIGLNLKLPLIGRHRSPKSRASFLELISLSITYTGENTSVRLAMFEQERRSLFRRHDI